MSKFGIVITSHVHKIAEGIAMLLSEVGGEVPVTFAGGTDEGDVGSSFDKTMKAFKDNEGETLLCFFDLGSAKMTLEMVMEMSEKKSILFETALVESAFSAAVLANAGMDLEEIEKQLLELKLEK